MKIKLKKKITEKVIDEFIDSIYKNFIKAPNDKYYFDFTEVEWISNQELLVFTGLLKYFLEKKIDFEIEFIKKGTSINNVSRRAANQLVQIWDIWKIWMIVEDGNYYKYFGIDGKAIDQLKKIYNIRNANYEIYERYGITPFVSLDYIQNYNMPITGSEIK